MKPNDQQIQESNGAQAAIERSETTIEEKHTPMLVSVHYKGLDNGTEKEGFSSLSLEGPKINNADELQELTDAIATVLFKEHKYEDLKITIISVIRYPF